MACVWILIGRLNYENGSWLAFNDMPDPEKDPVTVWICAFYWIFQVYSTVGYGDLQHETDPEKLFGMFVMFSGVTITAILMTTLSGMFDEFNYDNLLDEKMDVMF